MKRTEDINQNGFTNTWMLFESGKVVPVGLSLFSAPKENSRPIDAYVVTEAEGTVTLSARRAAGAVYEVVCGYRSDIGPIVAGFDFTANFPVTGESGGLAFAVSLAKHLLNKDPGPVAATGIVQSSINGGQIKGVLGIVAKLKAAGQILPPGGFIFFPEENEHEIPAELHNHLVSKGLKPIPVSTVAQTIEILFGDTPLKNHYPSKKSHLKKSTFMSSLFFVILLAAFAGIVLWKDKPFSPEKSVYNSGQHRLDTDQPLTGNIPHENGEKTKAGDKEIIVDPDKKITDKEHYEIEEKIPGSTDAKQKTDSVTVNIFGKTRLNAEISKVLTTKLKNFFALPHHHLTPAENVVISGQVVVLRIEENWIEEKQRYKSNIRVALRDFLYQDKIRKFERSNIEVTVYAGGMVEDMLPLAAQELMNKMLNSLLTAKQKPYNQNPPPSDQTPSAETGQTD